MDCIDYLYFGIDSDKINVKINHFNERAQQNSIPISFIVESMTSIDPIYAGPSKENGKYEAFYPAPDEKCYNHIKVVFAFNNNMFDLITVMPCEKIQYT